MIFSAFRSAEVQNSAARNFSHGPDLRVSTGRILQLEPNISGPCFSFRFWLDPIFQSFMCFLFTVMSYYDSVVIFIEVFANGSVWWSTGKVTWLFFPYPSTIIAIATTCSQYLLVLLSLNKYFDFCDPKNAAKYFKMAKVKRYIGLINIFALIVNFPHFFELNWEADKKVLFKCWACSPIYQYGFLTGFKLLIRWSLPSLCLIFTNLSVYRKVIRMFK